MTTQTEQVIFKKLEDIDVKVDSINVTLSNFMAVDELKTKRHDAAANVVFGNGKLGLNAKMLIVWSLLGGLGVAVLALVVNWLQNHFSHTVC
ncbi:hypothetical protein LCGC14_3011780 [marine sediment metagenome]|uniref:Uncharacterized protein n=1 Tax=marine sediment metagenome TaxID=412755 RepID=A0A0F8ZP59_9ZZZZ